MNDPGTNEGGNILKAPWTFEQVEALELRQEATCFHPYTCHCGESLIPSIRGWEGESCACKQDWCHATDADIEKVRAAIDHNAEQWRAFRAGEFRESPDPAHAEDHALKPLIERKPNESESETPSEHPSDAWGGWKTIWSAPKTGEIIEGLYDDGPCLIRWAESRRCMLAGVGGGNGYFGPGWEDDYNGLIVDPPSAWREAEWADPHISTLERELASERQQSADWRALAVRLGGNLWHLSYCADCAQNGIQNCESGVDVGPSLEELQRMGANS